MHINACECILFYAHAYVLQQQKYIFIYLYIYILLWECRRACAGCGGSPARTSFLSQNLLLILVLLYLFHLADNFLIPFLEHRLSHVVYKLVRCIVLIGLRIQVVLRLYVGYLPCLQQRIIVEPGGCFQLVAPLVLEVILDGLLELPVVYLV